MNRLAMTVLASIASTALLLGANLAPAAAITVQQYDAQVISHTNIHRKNHDKATLSHSACLNDYAQAWSRTMATRGKLQHRSSASMRSILKKCNLRSYGENIAAGYPTGHAAVSAWMKSKGHRANILKGSYRLVAVGATQDSKGRWWSVQVFGQR